MLWLLKGKKLMYYLFHNFLHALLSWCGTIYHSPVFPSYLSLKLYAYVDANWASDLNDCKSTTSFCIFLGDSLIS